jgi:hypothetical protein
MPKTRAKFKVSSVTTFETAGQKQVELWAVWDDGIPENARFAKATPSGQIKITIDNPPAAEIFAPGKFFYVDFTLAE